MSSAIVRTERTKLQQPFDPQRQHEIRRERKGVEQGQDIQKIVRGIKPDALNRGGHIGCEITVREHGAFGFAGRAGGVDDRRDRAGSRDVPQQPSLSSLDG
jgi:hypothetical protein